MPQGRREELTAALLEDPARFNQRGDAYQLLQEYFRDLPVEDLRALLRNVDPQVQRAAIWLASELGSQAAGVLEEAVALTQSSDLYIAYHALETVGVCAEQSSADASVYVLQSMAHQESAIRRLAMRLLGNFDISFLENLASKSLPLENAEDHARGLGALVQEEPRFIAPLLESESALLRKYGGILARRVFEVDPTPIMEAMEHDDSDVRSFAEEIAFVLGDD